MSRAEPVLSGLVVVPVDASSGPVTVSLPHGREIRRLAVVKADRSAHPVTITGARRPLTLDVPYEAVGFERTADASPARGEYRAEIEATREAQRLAIQLARGSW